MGGVGVGGVDINVSEVHLSPSSEWKSLLEMVLLVNENIFRKTRPVMASIWSEVVFLLCS